MSTGSISNNQTCLEKTRQVFIVEKDAMIR
jgi:hypothetical protein